MTYKILAAIFAFTVVIYMIAEANSTPMKKTNKYLYKISDACEGLNLYIVTHTEEENKKYVTSLSTKLNEDMNSLKRYADKLPDNESVKTPLLQFIAEWNNEKIENSLLLGDSQFQSDLGYLKSLIPDKRREWKTPFPIYRP